MHSFRRIGMRSILEQLTAERICTRYVKALPAAFLVEADGRRNEALDCRVYAYAALRTACRWTEPKQTVQLPPVPVNRKVASNVPHPR